MPATQTATYRTSRPNLRCTPDKIARWGRAWAATSSRYSFRDRMLVRGDLVDVADRFLNTHQLSAWWRQFRSVEVLEPGEPNGVGRLVVCHVQGFMPYVLRLEMLVTQVHYPWRFEVRVGGDLCGSGAGQFRQVGDDVLVELELDIEVKRPLVRALSLLMRPVLRAQHQWVMQWGRRHLQRSLAPGGTRQPSKYLQLLATEAA